MQVPDNFRLVKFNAIFDIDILNFEDIYGVGRLKVEPVYQTNVR